MARLGGPAAGRGSAERGKGDRKEARSQRSATPDTRRGGLPGNRPAGRRRLFPAERRAFCLLRLRAADNFCNFLRNRSLTGAIVSQGEFL